MFLKPIVHNISTHNLAESKHRHWWKKLTEQIVLRQTTKFVFNEVELMGLQQAKKTIPKLFK